MQRSRTFTVGGFRKASKVGAKGDGSRKEAQRPRGGGGRVSMQGWEGCFVIVLFVWLAFEITPDKRKHSTLFLTVIQHNIFEWKVAAHTLSYRPLSNHSDLLNQISPELRLCKANPKIKAINKVLRLFFSRHVLADPVYNCLLHFFCFALAAHRLGPVFRRHAACHLFAKF